MQIKCRCTTVHMQPERCSQNIILFFPCNHFPQGFHGFILIGFTEIRHFEDVQNNTPRSNCDVTICGAYHIVSVIVKKYFFSPQIFVLHLKI